MQAREPHGAPDSLQSSHHHQHALVIHAIVLLSPSLANTEVVVPNTMRPVVDAALVKLVPLGAILPFGPSAAAAATVAPGVCVGRALLVSPAAPGAQP